MTSCLRSIAIVTLGPEFLKRTIIHLSDNDFFQSHSVPIPPNIDLDKKFAGQGDTQAKAERETQHGILNGAMAAAHDIGTEGAQVAHIDGQAATSHDEDVDRSKRRSPPPTLVPLPPSTGDSTTHTSAGSTERAASRAPGIGTQTDRNEHSAPSEIRVKPGQSLQIVNKITLTADSGLYEVNLGHMAEKNSEKNMFVAEESFESMVMKIIEWHVSIIWLHLLQVENTSLLVDLLPGLKIILLSRLPLSR